MYDEIDTSPKTRINQALALLGWVGISFTASITGIIVSTEGWFEGLQKPIWEPPNWIFGPVWTFLYLMMGLAAWFVWRQGGWAVQRIPLWYFLLQLFLNACWTPLFFGMHFLELALVEIVLLWLSLTITMTTFFRVSKTAFCLMIPYWSWVSYATALNFIIWRMNS
jgi:tryptophan-rich sensory protein